MKLIKWMIIVAMFQTAKAQVVINEFMASNTTTVTDNFGEYDDWVELYNTSNVDVDISAWSITDSLGDLRKFKFKRPTIIPAKGYKIFWADEDSSQGNTIHMNFKLSSLGEMLVLVDSLKNIKDSITFGPQTTDKSMARKPNGTGSFVIGTSTFNANNDGTSSIFSAEGDQYFKWDVWSRSILLNENETTPRKYQIYDAMGRLSASGTTEGSKIAVGQLNQGLYWLKVGDNQFTFLIRE